MKSLNLTIIVVAVMLFSLQNIEAQITGEKEAPQEQQMHAQEDWKTIPAEKLPTEVQASIERDFAGATISEAFMTDKEGIQTFKIVLTSVEGESKTLYADAKGNWIDRKHKKTD